MISESTYTGPIALRTRDGKLVYASACKLCLASLLWSDEEDERNVKRIHSEICKRAH